MNKEFQWTSELVSEYAALFLQETFKNISAIQQQDKFEKFTTPDQFIASHTPEVKRENDWEVLEFRFSILGVDNVLFTLGSDGKYSTGLNGDIYNLPERFFIVNKASIHSVRRLSDNVVFSLGDELIKWGKVTSFKIQSEKLMVALCNEGLPDYAHVFIEDWSKLPERTKGCNICGGELILIRGRYPHSDKREVCPTCNTERLEQINEISGNNYGAAKGNKD